jgi:hypothetical protein
MNKQKMSKPKKTKAESNVLSISQSLVKNFWSYKEGEYCGKFFFESDVLKKVDSVPTEVMQYGHFFEFLCTGALKRDGSEPEEPRSKTGKPTEKGKRMRTQAERFKMLIEKEGIVIEETGTIITVPFYKDGFRLKGVLDIRGVVNDIQAIIDIKSSGLIGNEWEAFGWHTGTFNMRKKLTIQVVFYKYLAWKGWGVEDMPFYFIIHSTTNDIDSLFWEVRLHDFEVAMTHFEDMIFEIVEEIKLNVELGFTPYPSVKRCGKCPIAEECDLKAVTPQKEVVTIDGIFE